MNQTLPALLQRTAKQLLLLTLTCTFPILLTAHPSGSAPSETNKVSEVGNYHGYSEPTYGKGYKYLSDYVLMRDSVYIALDVFLPKKRAKDEKVPTILYQTRYVRSVKAKFPFSLIKDPVLTVISEHEVSYFTSYGYAVVITDVRGSGASTGKRTMEFSPAEVKDGAQVVDWIIAQPWSNKIVGTTGVSYFGTTAELLLANQHPAVKACVPRSSIFDLYNHMMFPGGVRQGPFVDVWGYTTRSLDDNNFKPFGKKAKHLVKGIHPVQGDKHHKIFKEALADHEDNFDVFKGLEQITYRDEKQPGLDAVADDYSVHTNRKAIAASGTPIYRIDGWYDGALKKSAIEGFWNVPNTKKVLIGPWDHGPHDNASPFVDSPEIKFDVLGEVLRFFDHYLKGIDNGIDKEKAFYYYTVGTHQWQSTDVWPPAYVADKNLYFSADHTLAQNQQDADTGTVHYVIDYTCNTGVSSRWNSVTGLYRTGHTNYNDWANEVDKTLSFSYAPFAQEQEMTGSPIVDLYIAADATDATYFVYIEDIAPDGTVYLVTEGQFRGIHRKVVTPPDGYKYEGPYHSYLKKDAEAMVPGKTYEITFDLLPISYVFGKGHQLRVSIAGTDCIHFDLGDDQPTWFNLSVSNEYPSSISLPFKQ